MGEDNCIDVGRCDMERYAVTVAEELIALEEPAIDQDLVSLGTDQVPGTRHGVRCAEKLQHRGMLFSHDCSLLLHCGGGGKNSHASHA
jgi:hypothetical protein